MPKIVLFGYSGSGKTALFYALTGRKEETYDPFAPKTGKGRYKDTTIDTLAEIHQAKKQVYPELDIFYFKGFPAASGFPARFFDVFFEMDMILCVVNNFDEVSDPQKDASSLLMELILYDTEKIQALLKKQEEGAAAITSQQAEILARALRLLDEERLLNELPDTDKTAIYGIQLLTVKKIFFYARGDRRSFAFPAGIPYLMQKETDNALFFPAVLKALSYITFYTVKGGIAQGWVIPAGCAAKQAAGRIHKDIEKGFIKAVAIPAKTLFEIGSWQAAKHSGALKTLGQHSLISDGDVVEFYFR
ncbi:MAG: DUF933 domain-containing protein [Elusimicrobia bacterium]|jgi:hypothetical protein|nr:DUF933 domain-containing protein [Elusimicrobiota bacterium]